MERFKLRVWDEENQKMIYNHVYAGSEGIIVSDNKNPLKLEPYTCLNINIVAEKGHLMKCLGWRDSEQKLIYEKDLMQISRKIYVVRWNNETLSFCFYQIKDTKTFADLGFAVSGIGVGVDGTIIGNIYENKDVLIKRGCKRKWLL